MNKDQIEGNWKQLKGEVKRQWGKLTDNQLTEIEGSRQKLAGYVQEAYGIAKEDADKQVNDWEENNRKNNAA